MYKEIKERKDKLYMDIERMKVQQFDKSLSFEKSREIQEVVKKKKDLYYYYCGILKELSKKESEACK